MGKEGNFITRKARRGTRRQGKTESRSEAIRKSREGAKKRIHAGKKDRKEMCEQGLGLDVCAFFMSSKTVTLAMHLTALRGLAQQGKVTTDIQYTS